MSELTDLYQEVILDHNKRPRNFRAIEAPTPSRRGVQPALRRPADAVRAGRGRRIADVASRGPGCAISKASASLMTDE
jgi:nitrogen fixation protein NifU and related proteins